LSYFKKKKEFIDIENTFLISYLQFLFVLCVFFFVLLINLGNLPCKLNFRINKLNEEKKQKLLGGAAGFSFYLLAICGVRARKKWVAVILKPEKKTTSAITLRCNRAQVQAMKRAQTEK